MRLAAAVLAAAALVFPAAAGAQEGTPVVGGGSFNTATLLKPGNYADTVAAGETVYWKIAIQKGQVLRVRASVDTSEIVTKFSDDGYLEGLAHLDYRLDIFSPLREQLSNESDYRDATTKLEGDDSAGAKSGEAVGPRALGFEQILAGEFNLDKFPAPGEWYISLSAADSNIYRAEVAAELPVALEVAVEGQAAPSSADFASKLPGPAPKANATPTSELLSGDTGPGDPVLTIALVGVLALAGGLGLGALGARLLPRP